MVGRDRELEAGGRLLTDLAQGSRCLVLEGEPGIGKSTVWREVVSRARVEGSRVLACRPAEAEAKFSFAGLADLLADVDRAVLSHLPSPQRNALEIALLEAAPGERPPDPRAVFAGFCAVLFWLASEGPLLVAIDDLQWLDHSSQSAIEFALRRAVGRPIGFLCAVRRDDAARLAHGLARALSESELERVRLGPLSVGALHEVLAQRLGVNLPRPLLVKIAGAARGNPFYALEISRDLASRGTPSAGEALPVPDDLSEFVRDRIRRLPAATRDELLVAAALQSPALGMLDGVALRPAEDAGLVGIDRGRVSFSHPLVASAVYMSASAAARRDLHRRLAMVVGDPEERSRHLALGAEEPSAEIALELDRAAERAVSRGAPDAAAELLELGMRLTPDGDGREAWRALSAADCHFQAGDLTQARALAERVLAGAPPPPMRGRALQILGEVAYHEDSYAEAVSAFEEALTHAEDQSHAVELHVNLSIASWNVGDLRALETHARAAVEVASTLDEEALLAVALGNSAISDVYLDRPVDRGRLERALALDDPESQLSMAMSPLFSAGFIELFHDNFDRAAQLLAEARQRALDRGQDGQLAALNDSLTAVERYRGNLAQALEYANEGIEMSRIVRSPIGQANNLAERCYVRAILGDVEGAREDARSALAAAREADVSFAATGPNQALAFLELSLGNANIANEALEPAAVAVEQAGGCYVLIRLILPDKIEALVAVGALDRAQALTELLERHGRLHDRASALARAARCRALIAASRKDAVAAMAEIEEALAQHARIRMPLELGRTLLVRGQLERRAKQKRAARESLERALALFEELQAPLWANRARSELERTGARHSEGDELTPTELRVAQLAAEGMTNKRIAESVFLSAKTVEANLARVYMKLGIRSRAELGRAMAEGERRGTEPSPTAPWQRGTQPL